MNKLERINREIQKHNKVSKKSWLKETMLGLVLQYSIFKLNIKVYFVNKRLNKTKGEGVSTLDRLTQIKSDIVNSLDADKTICLLVTVPDISIRDYFLADPLFNNFYANRVSFREKKLKNNKLMLCLIETIA